MINAVLPLLGAWTLAVMSPGPDFAATLRTPERALLPVAMLTIALAWFGLVALAASTSPITSAYRRAHRAIDTITGGIFAGIGAALMPR